MGRPFSEGDLFRVAYAFEQATRYRRPPQGMPPLTALRDGSGAESDHHCLGARDTCSRFETRLIQAKPLKS
jgi:hypothetical protein